MYLKTVVLLILSLLSVAAMAVGRVDIDHDEDDCAAGWMSMDVRISVDGEVFAFDPQCGFSFRDFFTTQKNIVCKVEAGMCTKVQPRHKLEVVCGDKSRAEIEIKCPAKEPSPSSL